MVSRMVSRSIYNLKIDTIYMYDIPFDRSFLQRSNGIRHVMPSTETKPELTAKASMAQPVSQPAVYANGLNSINVRMNVLHASKSTGCCYTMPTFFCNHYLRVKHTLMCFIGFQCVCCSFGYLCFYGRILIFTYHVVRNETTSL
jgi:hypothetical protein